MNGEQNGAGIRSCIFSIPNSLFVSYSSSSYDVHSDSSTPHFNFNQLHFSGHRNSKRTERTTKSSDMSRGNASSFSNLYCADALPHANGNINYHIAALNATNRSRRYLAKTFNYHYNGYAVNAYLARGCLSR